MIHVPALRMRRLFCGPGAALAALAALFAAAAGAASSAPAQRIVSLAPHLTELTYSAGAGERLVGVVEHSDHPAAARSLPRIGDAFRVDLERVAALRPDLVLAWESGTSPGTVERLESLGLRVVPIVTRKLRDVGDAIRAIGELAGAQAQADGVAAAYEARIAALRAGYRDRKPLSVFLQVNEQPLYTVSGAQIMSEVIEVCGGRNVFADLKEAAPTVGVEAVIAADPQVILATDATVPDARQYWSRWRQIAAVRNGAVYTISSDDVARPTARLADGVAQVCRALDAARERIGSAEIDAG